MFFRGPLSSNIFQFSRCFFSASCGMAAASVPFKVMWEDTKEMVKYSREPCSDTEIAMRVTAATVVSSFCGILTSYSSYHLLFYCIPVIIPVGIWMKFQLNTLEEEKAEREREREREREIERNE